MQLTEIQERDLPIIKNLRSQGVLQNILVKHLPNEGDEIIACSDGERIMDLLSHHRMLCADGRPCHHPFLLNGGPLLIPASSPVAKHGEGIILLEHALDGQKLKKVKTIHLYGHWPCGAAAGANLSIIECLTLLAQAKERTLNFFFQRTGEHPKVIPLFHVYHVADKKHRSYYFHRHAFGNMMQIKGSENWRSSRKAIA